MLAFGIQIRLMGFFGRQIIPKPTSFPVDCNVGSPFVLKPNHTEKSRFVVTIGSANILRVAISRNDSQIAQSIVVLTPVDVVNKTIGPDVMCMKPSKSVRLINFLFDAYRNVTKFVGVPCYVASMNGFARPDDPCKNTRGFVIGKHRSQFICGQV